MSDARDRGRLYSEAEVALILRSAAELDARPERAVSGRGLALPQIIEIAREAGIDAAAVERAAAALERPKTQSAARKFFGAPARFSMQRQIAHEVSDNDAAAMLDAVRDATGLVGQTDDALGALEWRGKDSFGSVFLRIDRRAGSTRIMAGTDRTESAILTVTLSAVAGMFLVGASLAGLGLSPPLGLGVGVVGGFGVGRFFWQRLAMRWRARMHALLDRIAETGQPRRESG